jgi:hypothetical protein
MHRIESAADRLAGGLARRGPRAAFALVAAGSILLVAGPAAAGAADDTTSFRPAGKAGRALVFRPRGVDASRVRDASVKLRLKRRSKRSRKTRPVSVNRVRRAISAAKPLRVHVRGRARTGRLVLRFNPRAASAPTTDGCTFGSFSSANMPGACWRPFSDQSPFNVGVGTAPRPLSGSSAIVSRTLGFGAAQNILGGVTETDDDWDHPLYYSQPSDPLYTVSCTQWVSSCEVEGVQLRIPAAAMPAGGGDGSMGVIDQAAGMEYDFWQVSSKPAGGGTLQVSHGGMTAIGSADADGLGSNADAAHFATSAGVIRPPELEAGLIDHALFMVVKCTNGTRVWPAHGPGVGRSCSSIGLSNADAPALGQHFYLDLSDAEIDALAVPEWKRTILRAMADYGMFVGDTGGSSWRIKIESGSSYTSFGHQDPWVEMAKRWGVREAVFNLDDGVPWDRLRVADPCVAQRTC